MKTAEENKTITITAQEKIENMKKEIAKNICESILDPLIARHAAEGKTELLYVDDEKYLDYVADLLREKGYRAYIRSIDSCGYGNYTGIYISWD